jgi:hypothetical protein
MFLSNLSDIAQCFERQYSRQLQPSNCFYWFLDLIFGLEDGGNVFIRNVGFKGVTTQNTIFIIACENIKPVKEIIKHVGIIIRSDVYWSSSGSDFSRNCEENRNE